MPLSRIFNVANMSFNTIRENKISKITTYISKGEVSITVCSNHNFRLKNYVFFWTFIWLDRRFHQHNGGEFGLKSHG